MERRRIVNRQAAMFPDDIAFDSTSVEMTPEKEAELKRALADLLLNASHILDLEEDL